MSIIYYETQRGSTLCHHGIKGQKWGVQNGPPYPLDASDHSASENKAEWRKSLKDKSGNTIYESHKTKKLQKKAETAKESAKEWNEIAKNNKGKRSEERYKKNSAKDRADAQRYEKMAKASSDFDKKMLAIVKNYSNGKKVCNSLVYGSNKKAARYDASETRFGERYINDLVFGSVFGSYVARNDYIKRKVDGPLVGDIKK